MVSALPKCSNTLKQKYGKEGTGQVKFDDSWVDEATELLEQYAPDFDRDDQTSVDVSWPSVGDEEVTFTLKHQAFFPVKDVIVDEDTHRLRWEIRQDAQNIADDTLYPNPRIRTVEVLCARQRRLAVRHARHLDGLGGSLFRRR